MEQAPNANAWQKYRIRYNQSMNITTIDYSGMIDRAMRQVVRESLILAHKQGLPGQHHFYISFLTGHPGVRISETLRAKYPDEMTIILQHQFWDLKVEEDQFSVMLSFGNIPEKLVVSYSALTAFADPSIKFGLQFHTEQPTDQQNAVPRPAAAEQAAVENAEDDEASKVISIDSFRKK